MNHANLNFSNPFILFIENKTFPNKRKWQGKIYSLFVLRSDDATGIWVSMWKSMTLWRSNEKTK